MIETCENQVGKCHIFEILVVFLVGSTVVGLLNFVVKLLPTPAKHGSLSSVSFCKLESQMPRSRSKENDWARAEGLALAWVNLVNRSQPFAFA